MKKSVNKSAKYIRITLIVLSLFFIFNLWAATQSSPYTAQGSSTGDMGESLVAQEDFEWTSPTGGAPYSSGHTVYSDDYKFCFATTATNTDYGDWKTDKGVSYHFNDRFGIGFRLKGGKTYKLTAVYSGDNMSSVRGVKFLEGATFNGTVTTLASFQITAAQTQETGVLYVSPASDTTYWLTGISGAFSRIYSFKCEISTQELITSSRFWGGSDSQTLTGLFDESHMLNVGTTKTPTHNPEVTRSDVKYPTYDFTDSDNDYITFKVGKGSGTIRVFYKGPGTVTEEVQASTNGTQTTSLLKKGDSFAGATTVASLNSGAVHTGMDDTQILTYGFVNSNSTDFYVTGGMIGAIEVNMDYDPTDLEPITEDFVWYGFGTGLSLNPQGGRLAINHTPLTNESVTLTVNGTPNTPTNKLDPSDTPRQALAFKLAPNMRYVVQIFTDTYENQVTDRHMVYISNDPSTNYSLGAVLQLAATDYSNKKVGPISNDIIVSQVRDASNWNTTTNNYVYTYAISDAKVERVCWIYPDRKTNIGAIQILPYIYKASLPEEVAALSHNEAWKVDDVKTAHQENSSRTGTDAQHDKVSTALTEANFYVYGPSMLVNERQMNVMPATDRKNNTLTAVNSKSVMLTKHNAIGLRLAGGAKITVNYVAENVDDVILLKEASASASAKKDNNVPTNYVAGAVNGAAPNYQISYTNEGSSEEVVWIRGANRIAYLSGYYVEIDPDKLQTIVSNHIYKADESLTNKGLIDERHLKYMGEAQAAATTGTYHVPQTVGSETDVTYDKYYSLTETDSIGFKLLVGKRGRINVYYYNSDELGNMGSGSAGYDMPTRTITFPGYDNHTQWADGQRGWWFGDDGTDFSATDGILHLKFDTSTFDFAITVQDADGDSKTVTVPVSSSSIDIDMNDLNLEKLRQIYFYSDNPGNLTIISAIIGDDPPLTLYTGTDERFAKIGAVQVNTRVSKSPYKNTTTGTYVMTHRFNHTQSTSDVLYWLTGDVDVAAIEIIYEVDEIEPATSLGYNGYIYINHKSSSKTFPFKAREDYWGKDILGTNLVQMTSGAKDAAGSKNIMKFLPGTTKVYVYRSGEFQYAGVTWNTQRNAANQGGYLNQYMTSYAGDHVQSADATGDKKIYDVTYQVNANPQTECNSMIGGEFTEDGGLFLQPISGDFFRLEPEYDGVVTMWILQNGNTDGNTKSNGELTRRPTYIVDENGEVMRRSDIKPSFELANNSSRFAINGTWVDLNTESNIRDDYSVAWNKAIEKWNGDWKNGQKNNGQRYKETMRMYDFWYDGGSYTNDFVGDNIQFERWVINEDDATDPNSTLVTTGDNATTTLADNMPIGLIIYGSDNFRRLETEKGFNNWKENKFSKYGYEVPVHVHVRYIFPVRAGKTYYLGGRGTKNDFMGVKFEPMWRNYNHRDYIDQSLNFNVSDGPNKGKYILADIKDSDLSPLGDRGKTYDATKVESTYIPSYDNAPTITISDNNSSDIDFENLNDSTVNVTLNRTFKAKKWYPIVLPFSVSESRLRELFGADVQVLYLDPYDHTENRPTIEGRTFISAISEAVVTSKLRFTRHYYQMLYANIPAFICPGGKLPNGNNFEEVTSVKFDRVHLDNKFLNEVEVPIKGSTTPYKYPVGYKIGEVGNYEYYVVGDYKATTNSLGTNTEMYFMDNSADTEYATVFHSHNGVAMKATRCWIIVKPKSTGGSQPPRLSEICFGSFFDEDIDMGNAQAGIEDIVMDDITIDMYNNDDNVYDLMGRVVGHGSLSGLTPGIYIFHGQKHYIR